MTPQAAIGSSSLAERQSKPKPTSARVAAAMARLTRRHAQMTADAGSVFGCDGAALTAFRDRVNVLIRAARLEGSESVVPLEVAAALLHLSDVPLHAARVHELAVWLHAVCQAIEAGSAPAARMAVHLASIIAECELIGEIAV